MFLPNWVLDIDYWFNNTWGIGLHNDIEIEAFVVKNAQYDEVASVYKLVSSIDAFFYTGKGFACILGPGM